MEDKKKIKFTKIELKIINLWINFCQHYYSAGWIEPKKGHKQVFNKYIKDNSNNIKDLIDGEFLYPMYKEDIKKLKSITEEVKI